jgi:hypothetical protein
MSRAWNIGASERFPRGSEDSVVRTHQVATTLELDRDVAILPNIRINDRKHDRILGDVGHRVGEEKRSGEHVERWDEMGEVDDRTSRRDPVQDRMRDSDPLVAQAEVAEEDDGSRDRRHRLGA